MNADLKRVRGDDAPSSSSSPAKRRALSVSSPIQVSSGDGEGGVEEWQAIVEVKRKEAIYRQMLEYRRMHSREMKRANELEAQKRVLEASVQAVEVCWSQLVAAIRDLAGRNMELPEGNEESEPIIDPQLSRPELDAALSKRLPSTRNLISSFVGLSAKNGTTPAVQDLHTKCSRLQAESSTLKSRNRDLQAQVTSLREENETTTRDLLRAQKALDRQRMEHDKAQEEWKLRDRDRDKDEKDEKRNEGERGSSTPNGNVNGSGHATPNGKVENDEKPFDANAHAGMLMDTTELEEKAASRLKQLEALRQEHTALQQQYDQLKISSSSTSEQTLRNSPFFQIYLHQLSTHYNRAQDLQQRFDASEKKLDELRSNNFEFRELIMQEGKAEADALRAQITVKNTDLSRLRASRDEKEAELVERRARETEKMRFAEEVEALAKVREERIVWLESEIKRLKGRLGAESGSEGYLSFLRAEGGIDGDYVKGLEDKLADAETRISALSAQSNDVETAAIRADLETARAKLDKYEKLFGASPDVASEAQNLANQLKRSDAEREALKLQVQEAEEATNALYAEIEGLSNLCDNTTKTMSQKTYELKDAELKMNRLATEKAKANNKYFAAMQSKDVLDQENKSIQRTVEKQSVWLQKAQEVERGLNAQIAAHEKGLTALKNTSLDLQKQLAQISSEKSQLELRLQQAQSTLAEAQRTMHQRVADYAAEKAARAKLEEEVEEKQRKLDKLKERHEAMVGASAGKNGVSASEYELQRERDKLWKLMRCSCCNNNFKQQVITRCMHTFCKKCLDDRIANRSRKCPACGVAFSAGEVQTIYWQ